MVSSSTILYTVNPVPAILTRLVALQDDPTTLPPEQTLKEPSTRPLPVRHRPAKLGTTATPPWNLCTAQLLDSVLGEHHPEPLRPLR